MKTDWILTAALAALLTAGAAAADNAPNPDRIGDRIDTRLDRRGDRIDYRLDRASDQARQSGHPRAAKKLDRRGDRLDRRLDRLGDRIDRRLDRRDRNRLRRQGHVR